MDIGNLNIFKNRKKEKNTLGKEKDDWEKIGDYEGESTNPTADTCDDDEEGCIFNKENILTHKKSDVSDKERRESDEAALIASQAAKQKPSQIQSK